MMIPVGQSIDFRMHPIRHTVMVRLRVSIRVERDHVVHAGNLEAIKQGEDGLVLMEIVVD